MVENTKLEKEISELTARLDDILKADAPQVAEQVPSLPSSQSQIRPPSIQEAIPVSEPEPPKPHFKKKGFFDKLFSQDKPKRVDIEKLPHFDDKEFTSMLSEMKSRRAQEERPAVVTITDAITQKQETVPITVGDIEPPDAIKQVEERSYLLKNGVKVSDLEDLYSQISAMTDEEFRIYVAAGKNLLGLWIRDSLGNYPLGQNLAFALQKDRFLSSLGAHLGKRELLPTANVPAQDDLVPPSHLDESPSHIGIFDASDEKLEPPMHLEEEVSASSSVFGQEAPNVASSDVFDDGFIASPIKTALSREDVLSNRKLLEEIRQRTMIFKQAEQKAKIERKNLEKEVKRVAKDLEEKKAKARLIEQRTEQQRKEIQAQLLRVEDQNERLRKRKESIRLDLETIQFKQAELEKTKREYEARVEMERKALLAQQAEVHTREERIHSSESEIESLSKRARSSEDEWNHKLQDISFKEKEVRKKEEEVQNRLRDVERMKEEFLEKFDRLAKEKEDVQKEHYEIKLLQERVEMAQVDVNARAERLSLEENRARMRDAETKKTAEEALKSRKLLMEQEEDLKTRNLSLLERERRVKSLERDVELQMKDLKEEKREIEQKKERLLAVRQETGTIRQEMDARLASVREEVKRSQDEWDALVTEQREVHRQMDVKRTTIVDSVQSLKGREIELIKITKEIAQGRKEMEEREKNLNAKLNKLIEVERSVKEKEEMLTRLQNSIGEREKALVKNEERLDSQRQEVERSHQKLTKIKELKTDLKALERRHSGLLKNVERLQQREDKLQAEFLAKKTMIQEREKKASDWDARLGEKEKNLIRREQKLVDIREELLKEKTTIADEAFHLYLTEELDKLDKEKMPLSAVFASSTPEKRTFDEVYSLINEAKDSLKDQNLSGARKIYSQLQPLYQNLADTDEKRRIYYDILELKTDIELFAIEGRSTDGMQKFSA